MSTLDDSEDLAKFGYRQKLVTMIAVLWANLAYLLVTAALLRRRTQGWPAVPGLNSGDVFSLGRFSIPVNIAAMFWSTFMVVNVGWPRREVYGAEWQYRFAPAILTTIVLGTAFVLEAVVRRRRNAESRRPVEWQGM